MPDDETIDQVSPSYADVLFANALELEGDQTVTTGPRPGARGGEQPGQLIGRYTLVEVLGEGGFGSVWRAEQSEPVARQVALKIIKLGMDSREIITRFEQERQALAMMDHPHIAKIFDAGVTDAGRPYFVMELVHGEPMTTYCDCNRLTIRHRLELFIQVCQAIQHAHQKGVIHRDLKPSNILVAEHDGVPGVRVIDFGVAKATERSLTAETLQTIAGQVIGTPGYMSPEQADPLHLDIDTRSDVYSLGAVLYELLTGTLPLDEAGFAHAALEAILRRIREQDPPRPSNRITSLAADKQATTAQRRGMEATRLPHAVRGDLDWIVMKCLEKDRQRRYETVSGLAADVQRHLNDEPITARPPSAAYVAGRTIRRHKLAFAAAAVILLTLVMGIVISTSFYLRAETRRVEAQQARFEQEKLKAAATDAAAKFQRTATTADYQLATRTLATNPDFDYASMDYIARALETDPTNHSATALGMQQMMSRPRMLIRRAADPASALSSTEYIRKETYGEWRPEDILARDAVSMLRAPATTLTEPAGHPLIRNMALPLERWISAQDYPQGYSFHLYAMINGWHGHIARQTCLNEFEVCCVISPDRRHVLAVNKQGRWSLYRHEKDHPSQVSSGTFKDWPAADLGERDFYLFIDGGLQWVARGSYSIRTGANNPACGLWSLATGERVVNTITNPLKGVITVGFHPSGSLAAMGTFGRKLVLVDLATKKPLPFEKTYLGINSYTWITPDGLDISTGKESDGWGGEIMGLCSGHAAVPVHTSSSFEGRPFESGFRYRANHITSSPETEKEDAWLRALPEVHCGGMTPAILSLNASPNVIQWDKEGDIVFWCEGDKVFCKASLSSLSKPSAATALHEVKTAPVKHFKISHPLDQMVYTTREGLGFASLGKGLETLKEDAFVREAGLGRVALNHALGRGCVVQRVQMNDVLRTIDLRQRTLLGGHTAVWGEKAADKEAAIRDLEFSPDGALLLVNGTGVPAYQLMSSAFLEIGPVNDFRLAGRQLATFMGTDVAWDTSGRFLPAPVPAAAVIFTASRKAIREVASTKKSSTKETWTKAYAFSPRFFPRPAVTSSLPAMRPKPCVCVTAN
jgi:serine/threonine protein kinase